MDKNTRIPIWLDCDTGHDDAFAILLASFHPDAQLLGISTIYGNAPLTNTTYNTRAILKAIGREDVPVFVGAEKPACRAPASAPNIHGASGLDGTTCLPVPYKLARTDTTAVEAMHKALKDTPKNTAWLVATGALTNVALLFSVCPDLANHIAGVSIMGGAIGNGFTPASRTDSKGRNLGIGTWTQWAEFNVYLDPESASMMLSHEVLSKKTTLIPLDLTHQFLATKNVQKTLLYGLDGPQNGETSSHAASVVRKLFSEILTFFSKTYAEVFGLVDGPPLHDPLAVAAAFAPSLFDDHNGERYDVEVVIQGEHGSADHVRNGDSQCGRTIARATQSTGARGVRIPRSLDNDAVWKLLDECLAKAEARSVQDLS